MPVCITRTHLQATKQARRIPSETNEIINDPPQGLMMQGNELRPPKLGIMIVDQCEITMDQLQALLVQENYFRPTNTCIVDSRPI